MTAQRYWALVLLVVLHHRHDRVMATTVNYPGVQVNIATGQSACASSYYNYEPNLLYDTKYIPSNAIDGFVDQSSWWSSGVKDEKVFWQLNLTSQPPKLNKIVLRWHGYLTAKSYRLRVSLQGVNFQTIAVVANQTMHFDRVDTITDGLDKLDTRFKYLRVVMDEHNVCRNDINCAASGSGSVSSDARVIYGLREFEVWASNFKASGAMSRWTGWTRVQWLGSGPLMTVVMVLLVL